MTAQTSQQAIEAGIAASQSPRASDFAGRLNIYVCETCRGHIVTRDADKGVTPFMVGCRATDGCGGMMKSSMYRVFDQTMREDFEWYRPSVGEEVPAHVREHVSRGGLLLRKKEVA